MNIVTNEIPVEVTWLDGAKEEIVVRLPRLRDYRRYLEGVEDDAKTAELLTGLGPEDIDQLTDESVFAICDAAAKTMNPRIAAWVERQAAKIEGLAPVLKQTQTRMQAMNLSPGPH